MSVWTTKDFDELINSIVEISKLLADDSDYEDNLMPKLQRLLQFVEDMEQQQQQQNKTTQGKDNDRT
tara:strand:- start:1801 stop:2001 length:201 start_codon:yes stop_codon:yes gene_type:complete